MDITTILNNKGPAAAAAAEQQLQQQLAQAAQASGRSPSDTGSERGGSPHASEHSSRYSSRSAQPLHVMSNVPNGMRYPSPPSIQTPLPMLQNGYVQNPVPDNGYIQNEVPVSVRPSSGESSHKAFSCQNCGKGFARRSDLARHDCQKTFTRRTTLTRHQNHHTGTIEESIANTTAALASRSSSARNGLPTRSDGGNYSNAGSPMNTPSPNQRPLSLSPSAELPSIPVSMHRQVTDFSFMGNGSLPSHMRNDMQQQSPRNSPLAMPQSLTSHGGGHTLQRITSHPSPYGPPTTLEPPMGIDQRLQQASTNGSPHMSTIGWQSPPQPGLASPSQGDSYVYPEPLYGATAPQLYYPNSNIRRPQSTEPDGYDTKPRMGGEVWAAPVS
ncbi:MAG: hypothetical protein M1827_003205 [Pycnora praestabilis]|nr:MAG: hypothetical protein M1827_003205 [Pycnora praestabilis]